ncbi:hypothetical protein [Polyangium aurulentum]|uniref:hypothetical protein n=1 Tax=Polyangium aurulentum TaxID=2567896 RepID=UPI0010AE6957|nr:hypothetical protein [Polyangium aurulentum]UQA59046.1 hypothetical protein E8A73_000555 [Polyangium aurulentum]
MSAADLEHRTASTSPRGPASPTLLVGLGHFGREVASAVLGPGRGPPGIAALEAWIGPAGGPRAVSLDPAAKDPHAAFLARARGEIEALLDIHHYLAHSSPTDPRGPQCDVFLVADLGEEGMAPLVAPLVAALAGELRRAFSPILRSGDGALVVSPLLFCPRSGDRAAMGAAARALADLARREPPLARPGGRTYLVEDQSGKYLIPRPEMVRAFAAFLSATMLSGVRDDDRGLRRLVDAPGADAVFSTFACATLVFDHAALGRLAAARLGREILSVFRTAVDPAALDLAALAAPLVPDRTRLEAELGAAESAVALLSPPALDVPEIEWDDSPEAIVERKFGSLFRARAEKTIAAFRDDVERFKMDRLAAAIEQRGKACLDRVEAELEEHIAAMVAEGPTGHARCLEILRDAGTRARGLWAEVVRAVEAPQLEPLPPSPLGPKLAALEEAVASRPRPYRMAALGGIAALLYSLLVAGLLVGAHRWLHHPFPLYFDALAELPPGRLRPFVTPPAPLVLGAALGVSSTAYRLWKHRKRHHNWVVSARDDLAQALARHLREDVIGHYERRLHYTRLLWVQRIYGRLVGRIEEAIAGLEAVRAALSEADRVLAREEHAGVEALGGARGAASVLWAHVLGPGDVDAVYAEIRPPEVSAAADRHLRKSLEARPWRVAPFAAPDRLLAFCSRELGDLAASSPFEDGTSALARAAAEAVRGFLRRLLLKLSPPLELAGPNTFQAPPPLRVLLVPPEARRLVESTLAEGGFEGAWEVRALSGDPHRIHLVVAREGVPLEALALARSEGAPP